MGTLKITVPHSILQHVGCSCFEGDWRICINVKKRQWIGSLSAVINLDCCRKDGVSCSHLRKERYWCLVFECKQLHPNFRAWFKTMNPQRMQALSDILTKGSRSPEIHPYSQCASYSRQSQIHLFCFTAISKQAQAQFFP